VTGGHSEEMEDGELDVTTAAVGGHSPPAASGLPQDSAPPAVEAGDGAYLFVLNPLADEIMFNGGVALVRWASNVPLTHLDIRLSDGTVIATRMPLDAAAADGVGSYYWAVRAEPNPAYTLHITGYPESGHGPALVNASAPFAVRDQTGLTVTAPAKDAVVVHGESTWIRWAVTGAAAMDVVISIAFSSTDDDAFFFGSVPNSGEFLWVPSPSMKPGRYRVKIEYSPPSQANVTTLGAPFRLRKPARDGAIAFATPAEGDVLESGKTFV
jgi:hypothetical protein